MQPDGIRDVNARRTAIDVPVLAISGAVDADDHRRLTDELLRAVEDGREVLIPGSAHYPNLENPVAFDGALSSYLLGRRGRTEPDAREDRPPRDDPSQ